MLNLKGFLSFCISAVGFLPVILAAGDYESAELCLKEKKFSEAVKFYRKAADEGHAEAQLKLGGHYYGGIGVERNFAEAAKWFRRSADQGHLMAQCLLGNCYFTGAGVPLDRREAMKWFRKSADGGFPPAVYAVKRLGNLPEFR